MPSRHVAPELALEVRDIGGLRPASQTTDGLDRATGGRAEYDGRDAAEIRGFGHYDIEADAGRDAGVNRIATLFQDAQAGHGGQIVIGGHQVTLAAERGPGGLHGNSS